MAYVIDGRYIQDHFPGIGRYTYNLIGALGRVAPDAQFTVLHNPTLTNTRYDLSLLKDLPNVRWQPLDISTASWREQLGLPVASASLLHSPYYIKPYLQRIPSVMTLFDLLPIRFPAAIPNARARLLFRVAVQLGAKTSAHIIVPSAATRDDLVELLHVPSENITITPLAADAHFVPQSKETVACVRSRYGLPDEYVLYVGINKPHKNLAALVQAWRRRNDSKRALVIAGAWDPRYPLAKVDGIRLIQNVAEQDLPALYTGAQVFVFPSFYEGFGLPPLEAMACGAPVIASNVSSVPEVVGDAALLVNPRDPGEIAAAIDQIISDTHFSDELRTKALTHAKRFSWERAAQETWTVYRQVANM